MSLIYRWVVTSSLCLALSGCGIVQMMKDTTMSIVHRLFFPQLKTLRLDLIARSALNADDKGRSLSVVVRIYQLSEIAYFKDMTYDNFLYEDRNILREHLLARKEVILVPGGGVSVNEPIMEPAKYIGIVAFFRRVDSDGAWRVGLARKVLSDDEPVKLEAQGYRLTIMER